MIDFDWNGRSPFGKAFTPIHLAIALAVTCFVFGIGFLAIQYFSDRKQRINSTDLAINESTSYQQTLEYVKNLKQDEALDAIIVCGGGRPLKVSEPPLYVQSRCDISVLLYNHCQMKYGKERAPKILTLSAGTAHRAQLLHKSTKLPVWESYSSAQYIINKYTSFVNTNDIYMETVSYDTIGNAYFAKIMFSDILQWKNIAVITNDWHFKRTKAIFEWIYSIKSDKSDDGGYNMIFVNLRSNENKDLSDSARNARIEREEKSLQNVYKLQEKYNTLIKVHRFLHIEHAMYACSNSANKNKKKDVSQEADEKLMAAYGFKQGKVDQGDNVTEMFENIKSNYDKTNSHSNEKIATI